MIQTKRRWGKTRKYARDWHAYNEELVVRGTFYLDYEWVKSWNKELREMNKNKVGKPYEFPNSLIRLQSVWHQLIDYRGIEGVTRKLVEIGKLPNYNNYSTINRRVNQLETHIQLPNSKEINVACDASGMKMNMSGEYFQDKYGDGKKKYIKVTISADPYTKDLLKCDVSLEGEELSEPQIAMNHITELETEGYNTLKFWGDGSYDVHELFDLLDLYHIESAIKIRENATPDPPTGGSWRRSQEVQNYQELGYEEWAKQKQYGQRWPGTEGIFSAVKRKYGERARSKKEENMLREVKQRFWAYQAMKNHAKKHILLAMTSKAWLAPNYATQQPPLHSLSPSAQMTW